MRKKGILIPRMTDERWQELQTYPLRPDDTIISCFPRSGSTWMQHTVKLLRNGGRDDGIGIDDAIPQLDSLGTVKGDTMGLNPVAAVELASPRCMKVHVPYSMTPGGPPHTTKIKYIYIARNPKDVCVSNWYFMHTQGGKFSKDHSRLNVPWERYVDEYLEAEGMAGIYGGWLNHVLGWYKHRDCPNILFVKYEDMVKDHRKTVWSIAEFMGIEDVTEELVERVVSESSFKTMFQKPTVNHRKREGVENGVVYLRRGIIGDWKNHFTPEQNSKFEEKCEVVLKKHGIDLDYE